MTNVIKVKLSKYGQNLGSRLLGRQVFSDINDQLVANSTVILDFEDVRFTSLSFITELIDSLQLLLKEEGLSIIGTNSFIQSQVNFVLKVNKKRVELQPA